MNLLRTAWAVSGRVNHVYSDHGLTASQYSVLRILRGHRPDALSCGEILQDMVTRDSDVTRILDGHTHYTNSTDLLGTLLANERAGKWQHDYSLLGAPWLDVAEMTASPSRQVTSAYNAWCVVTRKDRDVVLTTPLLFTRNLLAGSSAPESPAAIITLGGIGLVPEAPDRRAIQALAPEHILLP